MLVDQDNADILALFGEAIESLLDGGFLGLVVTDQEIALCIGRIGDMSHPGQKKAGTRVLVGDDGDELTISIC